MLSDSVAATDIDGVVGGPPCQGFSLSGNRDPKDPRNSLFVDFARFVTHFRPRFFVMENVPALLSMRTHAGERVFNIIEATFREVGYKVSSRLLNAADYGVPQVRERLFVIGVRADYPLNSDLLFPRPKLTREFFLTVMNAVDDLPAIEAGEGSELQEFTAPPHNDYQRWAREGANFIQNHIAMRHTTRLVERFKTIGYGQSVKDVSWEHSALKRGNPAVKSGKVFSQNNMRVYPDRPSPTVAASFQSNFIHPVLHRNFTAREGARLQSFPDRYVFKGRRTTMSWEKNLSQYQQIGNAVPPLMAHAIAENLLNYFGSIDQIDERTEKQQLDLFGISSKARGLVDGQPKQSISLSGTQVRPPIWSRGQEAG
jgi:DNA (cytosine-5)-methyltransferase 1